MRKISPSKGAKIIQSPPQKKKEAPAKASMTKIKKNSVGKNSRIAKPQPQKKSVNNPSDQTSDKVVLQEEKVDTPKPLLENNQVENIAVVPTERPLGVTKGYLPSTRLAFMGALFSGLELLCAVLVIAITPLCAFDRKGKEAYFTDNPNTEYSFINAIILRISDSSKIIKTDDWGYIQRAYENIRDDIDKVYWEKYDVFIPLLVVGFVIGIYLFVISIFNFCQFYHDNRKKSGKGLILCLIGFLMCILGVGYIFMRFYKFYNDTKTQFQDCNCQEFEDDYFTSIFYFSVTALSAVGVIIFELLISLCFYCYYKEPEIAPEDNPSFV